MREADGYILLKWSSLKFRNSCVVFLVAFLAIFSEREYISDIFSVLSYITTITLHHIGVQLQCWKNSDFKSCEFDGLSIDDHIRELPGNILTVVASFSCVMTRFLSIVICTVTIYSIHQVKNQLFIPMHACKHLSYNNSSHLLLWLRGSLVPGKMFKDLGLWS